MADYRPPVAHPKGLEPAASMVSTRAPDLDTPAETPAPVAKKKAPARVPAGMPSPKPMPTAKEVLDRDFPISTILEPGARLSVDPAAFDGPYDPTANDTTDAPPAPDAAQADDSANEAPVTDAPETAA